MIFLNDDLFDAQVLRALSHSLFGGADFGEILATCKRIDSINDELFYVEFFALAERIRHQAEESLSGGSRVSARGAFLRASNYYRTAGIFLIGLQRDKSDPRLVESRRLERETFRLAGELMAIPPQHLAIPFENDLTLPAHWYCIDDTPRPTVILTGGYDGTVEEQYFWNGAAALERGYNVLAFDGPGQGSLLIEQNIPIRPDWENVVKHVVDYMLAYLPQADPTRIALIGLSFGGYLAPRACTREHRIAACISDCGPYDLFHNLADKIPKFVAKQLDVEDPNGILVSLLKKALSMRTGMVSAGWALRRCMYVHQVAEPLDFFTVAKQFSLAGLEHLITCPTLVCYAEQDDICAAAPTLYENLKCPKEIIQFTAVEGASTHCMVGARSLYHQRSFDWLDKVFRNSASVVQEL